MEANEIIAGIEKLVEQVSTGDTRDGRRACGEESRVGRGGTAMCSAFLVAGVTSSCQ